MSDKNTFKAIKAFYRYYAPVLVNLGCVGNCLSVYVLLTSKLRKQSSSYYLVALLISDTLYLSTLFITWFDLIDVQVFNLPVICETMVYTSSVCSSMSAWLVAAFSAERFVAVLYPLQSKSLCTISRAKTIIGILLIVTLIFYCPQLIYAGVVPKGNLTLMMVDNESTLDNEDSKSNNFCYVRQEWRHQAYIFSILDTVVTFLIPVTIVGVLNACISRNLWKFSKIRLRMTQSQNLQIRQRTAARNKSSKGFYSLTKMLLIVSTTCLALNLPSYIFRVLAGLQEAKLIDLNQTSLILLQQYSNIFFNANFGINFALYCISGQNFRKSVAAVCCGWRKEPATPDNRSTLSLGSSGCMRRKLAARSSTEQTCV